MTDQLDTLFRTLREAPEPAGLADSSVVRRRGDRRRGLAQALSATIAAVIALAVVVVVSGSLDGAHHGRPQPAASTPAPEPSTSLAANPLLKARDLAAVGIYQSFPWNERISADTPLAISCLGAPSSWSADVVQRVQFISNHVGLGIEHARLVETVASFSTVGAAQEVAEHLRLATDCTSASATGTTDPVIWQRGEVHAGSGGGRLGQLDQGSASSLYYHEVASARVGVVLVVLEWSSAGLPLTGNVTQGWDWGVSEEQMALALDRAVT